MDFCAARVRTLGTARPAHIGKMPVKPERNTGNPQGGLTGMVWVRMESFLSGMWAAMGKDTSKKRWSE